MSHLGDAVGGPQGKHTNKLRSYIIPGQGWWEVVLGEVSSKHRIDGAIPSTVFFGTLPLDADVGIAENFYISC